MNYFIFNGENSKDKGIIITKMPPISKPAKRIEKIIIPGKNGVLHQDDGTYETVVIQIQCAVVEKCNIKEIVNWLNGSGELILSNDPDIFYKANIINQIDYTSIVNLIHEFPLELELQPFSHSIEKYKKIYTKGNDHIFNIPDATAIMLPYIKVVGSGQINLTINNETMILNVNEYIELDCELLIAHKNYESADNAVSGNFFKLLPGLNEINILGNYTELEIIYRKAYL